MDAFGYTILAHHVCTFIFSLCSIKFSIQGLYQTHILAKSIKLSPTVTIYFAYILFWSVISFFTSFYLLLFWRIDTVIYDAYIVYYSGLFTITMLILNTLIETFLCIDRCFSIVFPFQYGRRTKSVLAVLTLLSLAIFQGFQLWINDSLINIPTSSSTTCRYFGCISFALAQKNTIYIKVVVTGINMICGFVLFLLLKFHVHSRSTLRRVNKTVITIIIASVVLDFTPTLISQLFQSITQQPIYLTIGPLPMTMSCLNTAISVGIYYRALKKTYKALSQAPMNSPAPNAVKSWPSAVSVI